MENLIKEHTKKFNKEPYIIGMFWNNQEALINGILKAIEDNIPYNEYNLLTDKEKKAYDSGELVF